MTAAHEQGTATFKAFARILGERSPSYVTQLKDAGRLVLTDDGKRVRVTESLDLIRTTADPGKTGVAARHAATRAASAAAAAPEAPEAESEDAAASDYDGHGTRRSRAMADKAEWDAKAARRDYEVSMGQLLPADEVEHAVRGAVITFRTTLENLPNILAAELSVLTDEGRVRVVLAEALEHASEELARQFTAIARVGAA